MSLKERDYVLAAQLSGVPTWQSNVTHVLPGLRPTLLVVLAFTFGDLLIGWRLLVGAEVARAALEAGATDCAFYDGKIAAAKFFAHNMLPLLTAVKEVIESVDGDVMELAVDAF